MLSNKALQKIGLSLLIIMAIIVAFLAVLVHYHSVFGLDVYLSRDLQARSDIMGRQSLMYNFLYFVSLFGRVFIGSIMILATATIFFALKYFREAIFILLTPIAAGINFLIKIIVDRERPTGNFVTVIDKELDPSFPSGHVVFYVVFFGFLIAAMFFTKKIPRYLRLPVVLFSALMIVAVSVSRIYLGAHWASDVIAGYLLGIILLSIYLFFYLKPHIKSS